MNENSNSKYKLEKEGSILEMNNYINNINDNTLNFKSHQNYNILFELSLGHKDKKITQSGLEKQIFAKFNIKYIIKYNCRKIYNDLIMYTLLFNKNTHLVSLFKDYMIYDYVDEFFKRYYTYPETLKRLPSFSIFYKNYLTFFCQPCFTNFKYNNLIQRNREKKAELFYNKNFRDKNKESVEDEGIIEDSEEEEDYDIGKTRIEKTIFNETVKKHIEKNSPINTSMALPESETKLKSDESGLLTSFDNQSSLRNILKNMKKIKKIENNKDEEISEIKKKKNIDKIFYEKNSNHNLNQKFNNKKRFHKNNYNDKDKDKDKNKDIENDKKDLNNKLSINNIIINNKKEANKIKDFQEIKTGKIKMNIKNYNKKNDINKILKPQNKTESLNEKVSQNISNANNASNKKISKNEKDNSIPKEKEEKNIYIKKIEVIKFSKARSNSNRNSNFKEKRKKSQIDNEKNKNINVNHSQNIINIIKHIKNLDKTKKPQNEIYLYKKNKINTITTKLKKNFSEKVIIKNSNKLNANENIEKKKYLSRNKEKNDDTVEKNEEISNFKGSNNNIKTYYGLYQRKTVSKNKKDSRLTDDFHELKNKSEITQQQQQNNIYTICPVDNKKKFSTNNISQIQAYQNMTRSRNSNNYHHNSCSMNNNSTSCNYNAKIPNKTKNNSNMQSLYKNSSYLSKNHSRQKTYNYINKTKNKMRRKNKSNRIDLNLLKTQNVEVILNQIKMLKPKIKGKKITQKNSESQRKKFDNNRKMNIISFENINIHNNTNINYNKNNNNIENYNNKNVNKIYTKLIKKCNFNTANKINIFPNNNLRYNKLKCSASEYELAHLKLDINKKSNSLKNLKQGNINNLLLNSNKEINNINIVNNKKVIHSNLQNFKINVPRQNNNKNNKTKLKRSYKHSKINSINTNFNPKISCESSNIKGMNYTNITNNTNPNNVTNNNAYTPINKGDKMQQKDLSEYFLDNNNINNNQNKTYFKEEIQQYSPLKHIHNVNININNQININNNDIITFNDNKSSFLIKKNIQLSKNQDKKSGIKDNKNIQNSKKILISRNKQNSLDFNSLNSFLSVNSNCQNLKKNYLNKKEHPLNILASSNNSNIKEVKKTTIYLQNFRKNKTTKINNNFSYNNNIGNYSSNIILLENQKKTLNKQNLKKTFKAIHPNNKTVIRLHNKNNKCNINNVNKKSKSKNNIDNYSKEKKIMKKSSTYQILPK